MRHPLLILVLAFALFLPVTAQAQRGDVSGSLETVASELRLGDISLIKKFYGMRDGEAAWQLDARNARGAARDFLGYVRATLIDHGLTERYYPLAIFEQKVASGRLMDADVVATYIVLKLARSLSGGDPVPTRSADHVWPVRRATPDIAQGLSKAVSARSVPQYLEGLAPHYTQYQKLREALARYREIDAKGGWIRLVPGFRYEPGQYNAQTPLLYQRLAQEGYLPFEAARYTSAMYDPRLVQAIQAFQAGHGLYPDAKIGPESLLALNMGVKERIDEIRANMARMRVTPPEAFTGIIINIPSYRLYLYREGSEVYQAPVVVGRPDRASPLLSSTISDFVINPAWYVPESIAEKDILPNLEKNPNLLEEMNMKGPDLDRVGNRSLHGAFVQQPGPENSLGRIKFNFPNKHLVYLHGTPHVELFDRDDRRISSGCIRLKKPEELAAILMSNSPDWSEDRLQERIESMKTQRITPRLKLPIKLLYWTAMVDAQNRVQFYNDVYQLDDAWLAPL